MATLKQFKVFKDEVNRLRRILLPDWDIAINFDKCLNKSWDAMASYNTLSHFAVIVLDKGVEPDRDDDYIKKLARHEVFHVVLSSICELAELHHKDRIVGQIEHETIHRLVTLLDS